MVTSVAFCNRRPRLDFRYAPLDGVIGRPVVEVPTRPSHPRRDHAKMKGRRYNCLT
jgi:hypothetical protein